MPTILEGALASVELIALEVGNKEEIFGYKRSESEAKSKLVMQRSIIRSRICSLELNTIEYVPQGMKVEASLTRSFPSFARD